MSMYKIIQNDKVVDVVKYPRFLRFLKSGVAITDQTSAQGIAGSDNKTIYSFNPVKGHDTIVAAIKEITLEEFERLQSLLSSGQKPSADESALAKAKRETINRLSSICKAKITTGFSIELSDGKKHSFKLTAEDQLNLLSLENQLNAGAEMFLYHETGQPCRFFARQDMSKIISTFRRYTMYHTTYFNVAKQYINSLVNTEQVLMFTYGTDVTSATDNVTIRRILINGGNF